MFNSFPYDEWADTVTDFWTWGGHNSSGTFIQLALGFILMIGALVGWVWMENRKLEAQAASLREGAALVVPEPGPPSSV